MEDDKYNDSFENFVAQYNRVKDDIAQLEDLEGKKVILLMGSIGCGKSTNAHAIYNGVADIKEDDKTGRFNSTKVIEHNGRTMFPVEHNLISKTKTPEFVPLTKLKLPEDHYICEIAGRDSDYKRSKKELPNRVALWRVLTKCSSFKLFVFFDSGHLSLARGKRFIQELTIIVRLLDHDTLSDKEMLKKLIKPFFVKFGEFSSNEHFENQLQIMLGLFKDKKKVLETLKTNEYEGDEDSD